MKIIKTSPGSNLLLGRQGENNALELVFSLNPWIDEYGPGTVQLLHRRKGDQDPYPVAVTQENDVAKWLVSEVDTSVAGDGEYQLHYYSGDTLVKSATGVSFVESAMTSSVDPPDPYKGWVDQVVEAGNQAVEAEDNARSHARLAKGYSESAGDSASRAAASANRASEEANRAAASVANAVKTVNGQKPDENGNVEIEVGGSGEGGAKPFIVTVNEEHMATIEYSTDKTSEEIYQAWVDGQIIVCKFSIDSMLFYELNPVVVAHSAVVFSNSAIVNSENQYTSLVINGSEVYRFDSRLATEEFVRKVIAESGGASPEQIEEAVNKYLTEHPVEGGVSFETGENLTLDNGVLSVKTTDQMEKDNTLPITSAGVYATVGNIEALLKTI